MGFQQQQIWLNANAVLIAKALNLNGYVAIEAKNKFPLKKLISWSKFFVFTTYVWVELMYDKGIIP